MNRKIRVVLLSIMLLTSMLGVQMVAQAAKTTTDSTETQSEAKKKTGWQKSGKYYYYYNTSGKMVTGWKNINGKYYYLLKTATETAPKGSRAVGFCTIGKKTFYFSSKGVLQTGWQTIDGQNYYFKKNGSAGTVGMMATGMQTIGGGRYLMKADGSVSVGWTTYKKKTYFFSNSTKLGTRGRAITGWKKIGKYKYYFNTAGVMQKSCWIDKKYYLDSDGHMMTSAVTPDGYQVNASGVKVRVANGWIKVNGKYYYYVKGKMTTGWKTISGSKYYFSKDGVRQTGWIKVSGSMYYLKSCKMVTGWQKISGNYYYFGTNGKMAVSTTVDGVAIGADGIAASSPTAAKTKILLIAGHGQGDVGAIGTFGSTTYYEYKLTREFATLIFDQLKAVGGDLSVEMYDQNYDCYQVLAGKKSGPKPTLKNYDYILEIHFNATAESGKDTNGDGNYKGVGMYVNSAKSNKTLDKKIVSAIAATGFKLWGGGVLTSSTLFNAKTCQAAGVSYGLLETAFIDDKDDMKFYNEHKKEMAKAAAEAIAAYFK